MYAYSKRSQFLYYNWFKILVWNLVDGWLEEKEHNAQSVLGFAYQLAVVTVPKQPTPPILLSGFPWELFCSIPLCRESDLPGGNTPIHWINSFPTSPTAFLILLEVSIPRHMNAFKWLWQRTGVDLKHHFCISNTAKRKKD